MVPRNTTCQGDFQVAKLKVYPVEQDFNVANEEFISNQRWTPRDRCGASKRPCSIGRGNKRVDAVLVLWAARIRDQMVLLQTTNAVDSFWHGAYCFALIDQFETQQAHADEKHVTRILKPQ